MYVYGPGPLAKHIKHKSKSFYLCFSLTNAFPFIYRCPNFWGGNCLPLLLIKSAYARAPNRTPNPQQSANASRKWTRVQLQSKSIFKFQSVFCNVYYRCFSGSSSRWRLAVAAFLRRRYSSGSTVSVGHVQCRVK